MAISLDLIPSQRNARLPQRPVNRQPRSPAIAGFSGLLLVGVILGTLAGRSIAAQSAEAPVAFGDILPALDDMLTRL